MKGKRYSEEQIVRILEEVAGGKSLAEACRQYGLAEATVYRWRQKYQGMSQSELKRLKELERENVRLKRIIAKQALSIDGLEELLGKEW